MYRGIRKWRDAVGGATLCCSVCCSVLGYASIIDPDTCRLLKHRLRARIRSHSPNGASYRLSRDHFSGNTCGSFIGKELTRFAESQAVFAFAVFGYDYAGDRHGNAYAQGCIFLKVLSWNTTLATKYVDHRDDEAPHTPKFKRVVKVIYTEADAASILEAAAKEDIMEILQHFVGGG